MTLALLLGIMVPPWHRRSLPGFRAHFLYFKQGMLRELSCTAGQPLLFCLLQVPQNCTPKKRHGGLRKNFQYEGGRCEKLLLLTVVAKGQPFKGPGQPTPSSCLNGIRSAQDQTSRVHGPCSILQNPVEVPGTIPLPPPHL